MDSASTVGLLLGMAISFPDCIDCRLHDAWRARLLEAEGRLTQNCDDESRAEYVRILKIFKDLVLHGIKPREKPNGYPVGPTRPF